MLNRVVVTSVGIISPIGLTAKTTWDNLLKGNSGIDQISTFDTNNLTVGRNSQPIDGTASDLTVSMEGAGFTLVYVNSTYGWLLKDK